MRKCRATEISYDAERDEEVIYGKGGDPRGYGTGNRKNSVKMSMLREDFDEICNVMQKKGVKSFFNHIFEKITVSYGNDGQKVVTDTLTNVKFSKFPEKHHREIKASRSIWKGLPLAVLTLTE